MLIHFSKPLLLLIGLIFSTDASAKVSCSYLNEYQSKSPDLRIQNYLNFYAKQGLGAPLKIKVPNCIAAESESALRERYAKAANEHRKNEKKIKSKNRKVILGAILDTDKTITDVIKDVKDKPDFKFDNKLETPSNFKVNTGAEASYEVITFQQIQDNKKNEPGSEGKKKEILEVPAKYEKGTATFCKALAVCELDDEVITISNLLCRGKNENVCPTADECYQDSKVALDKVNLQVEANLKFNDGTQNLEGEQSPSSATQGR